MSRGFLVDLSALRQAAQGVNGILDAVGQQNVSDIKCDKSAIGHDNLAETVSGFCDRWNVGVGNLATDGREIAGQLSLSVNVYRRHPARGRRGTTAHRHHPGMEGRSGRSIP
jgi:hypothetical protein